MKNFKKLFFNSIAISAIALGSVSVNATDDYYSKIKYKKNNFKLIKIANSTQAPIWPPAEVVDKDGNFVIVGTVLRKNEDGGVSPTIGSAIVSKNTVPPLNEQGIEDFSNPLGAHHDVIRELDLSEGSADRDIELYSLSFGPARGNFGGGPRSPKEGESPYNLNGLAEVCPEIFPSNSQAYTYTRDSFPLSRAPVLGFQGDQVAYDVDSGEQYDPRLASGEGCGAGCSGENITDTYPLKSTVTLGEWIDASAYLKVRLTDWDARQNRYTAAKFRVVLRKALPNSIYTIWLPRANVASNQGQPEYRQPTPGGLPNVILTDRFGNGSLNFRLENPFPAPEVDEQGLRVVGMAIDFHSDYQNWGACFSRLGAGVDIHAQFVSFSDGTSDFTDFETVAKQ